MWYDPTFPSYLIACTETYISAIPQIILETNLQITLKLNHYFTAQSTFILGLMPKIISLPFIPHSIVKGTIEQSGEG